MNLHSRISRREFVMVTGASAAGLALGLSPLAGAKAAASLVNPYTGVIPLVFPLRVGTYENALVDNWHAFREGKPYSWSHRGAKNRRAHDGIDVFPLPGQAPTVFAPFSATVAAVGVDGVLRRSSVSPPPWSYSASDIYGNFVWLRSTEAASAGYFFFACHLQSETTLRALKPDQIVNSASPLGVLGDTGNASGSPQLHVELHYPAGSRFACKSCRPRQSLTAINPFESLARAQSRP